MAEFDPTTGEAPSGFYRQLDAERSILSLTPRPEKVYCFSRRMAGRWVLQVIVAKEAFGDEGEVGWHVSATVSRLGSLEQRKPTDSEESQVARCFLKGIRFERDDQMSKTLTNWWEVGV